jgi:hypothetical protein
MKGDNNANVDHMFDPQLMTHFYDPRYVDDLKAMDAWFKYVYEFLPCVSKAWKDCLTSQRVKTQQLIFQHVTVSDEAIVQWLINLWYPKKKKRQENNWPEEPKSRGKGQHDIKKSKNAYTLVHNSLEIARKDIRNIVVWNHKFWKIMKETKSDLFDTNKERKSNRSIYDHNINVELPGVNDDQDIGSMITAANALAQLSPSKLNTYKTSTAAVPDVIQSYSYRSSGKNLI